MSEDDDIDDLDLALEEEEDDYNPSEDELEEDAVDSDTVSSSFLQRIGGNMIVSIEPTDNASRKASACSFLKRILETPTISGIEIPRSIRGTIYIDDVPHMIHPGSWQADGSTIYLAGSSHTIDHLVRIGILAAIANITHAIDEPDIINMFSAKLVSVVKDSVISTYAPFMRSTARPTRLAINLVQAQVAAELKGSWFLAGGAPAEVDASWITMDF